MEFPKNPDRAVPPLAPLELSMKDSLALPGPSLSWQPPFPVTYGLGT